jgi:hypothetical protein
VLEIFVESSFQTLSTPAAFVQGWENVEHSVHDSFEVGFIEVERHRMGIKTHEGAPRERT